MSSQRKIKLSEILSRNSGVELTFASEIPSNYSNLTNIDDLINYKNSMIYIDIRGDEIGNYYLPLIFLENQGIVYSFSENIITSYPTLKKLVEQGSVYVKNNIRQASPRQRLSPPRRTSPRRGAGAGASPRRTSPERKSPRRTSPERKSPRRTSPERKSPRRQMSPRNAIPGGPKSPRRTSPERKSPRRTSPRQGIPGGPKSPRLSPSNRRLSSSGIEDEEEYFKKLVNELNEFLVYGRGRVKEILESGDYEYLQENYLQAVKNYYSDYGLDRPDVIERFIINFIERAKNLGLLNNELLYTLQEVFRYEEDI
jgi:hypothetical protein